MSGAWMVVVGALMFFLSTAGWALFVLIDDRPRRNRRTARPQSGPARAGVVGANHAPAVVGTCASPGPPRLPVAAVVTPDLPQSPGLHGVEAS